MENKLLNKMTAKNSNNNEKIRFLRNKYQKKIFNILRSLENVDIDKKAYTAKLSVKLGKIMANINTLLDMFEKTNPKDEAQFLNWYNNMDSTFASLIESITDKCALLDIKIIEETDSLDFIF